jgi:hypothetical protein
MLQEKLLDLLLACLLLLGSLWQLTWLHQLC